MSYAMDLHAARKGRLARMGIEPPRTPVVFVAPRHAPVPRDWYDMAHVMTADDAAGAARITLSDILRAVSEATGFDRNDLRSHRRGARLALARHMAMWLARRLTTHSLPTIGHGIGGRDHSTISHGIARIKTLRAECDDVRDTTDMIEAKLLARRAP